MLATLSGCALMFWSAFKLTTPSLEHQYLLKSRTEFILFCQNCKTACSHHLLGSCIFQWQTPNRFMICLGGLVGKWTPNPRRRIDTEYTACYAQYITPWPLTHPRCAAAFFNLSIAHDRRQRDEAIHKALRHQASITGIWICLDCYACDFLKVGTGWIIAI